MDLRMFGIDIDEKEYKQNRIYKIRFGSSDYPYLLSKIEKPPRVLYAVGNIDLLHEPAIAIVGTRKPSNDGVKYAKEVAKIFVKRGFVIVSGLALGVDTFAIKSALENNGKVIAVLPTLGKITPKSNKKLAEEILNNKGLLISEWNTKSVQRYMFIERNRIISGISLGIIVIETGIKGGTMWTINYAKKQKRLIIVADIQAEGNRRLISEGYPMLKFF